MLRKNNIDIGELFEKLNDLYPIRKTFGITTNNQWQKHKDDFNIKVLF